ncbi:MAG: LPS export ABC transporter periplasmic protein LptC [Rhizobiaceae bacterium]
MAQIAVDYHNSDREIANMRTASDFARAYKHSRIVKALKLGLPVAAATLIGVFAIYATSTTVPLENFTVDEISLQEGKLVMDAPKMAGFDKNSRPYDVSAMQAIQDLAEPGKVWLKSIDARLPMDATSFANLDAVSGVFLTESEKLLLDNTVSIAGARGMDLVLENADIDIKSGLMQSDRPVKVTSENTKLQADSVRVEENGKRIIFNERVKMTIVRPVERGVSPAQTE